MSRMNRRVRHGRRAPTVRVNYDEAKSISGLSGAFPSELLHALVEKGFDVALCSCGGDLDEQMIGVFHPTRVTEADTMPCPRCKAVLRFVRLTREEAIRDHVLDGVSSEANAAELCDRKHPSAAHLHVLRGPNGERIEPKIGGMRPVN